MVTSATMSTIRTEWRSGIFGPPSSLTAQGQQQGDGDHGWDQENIAAEDQQAQGSCRNAGNGRQMVFGAEPLLHEDGDKQGGQHEIDALIIQRDQPARQCAQQTACHPVALVEHRHQEAIAVAAEALGGLVLGDEGISFVGQGKNKVGLFPACTLVGVHHRDAVEQVTGIDHQGGQGGGQEAGATGQQAHGNILHGAGVNKQAHAQAPAGAVAVLGH